MTSPKVFIPLFTAAILSVAVPQTSKAAVHDARSRTTVRDKQANVSELPRFAEFVGRPLASEPLQAFLRSRSESEMYAKL